MQEELNEFKIKSDEFERKFSEVQEQNESLLKEAEESQLKMGQLQEMIDR